jgi:hypothetical protein
MNLRRIGTALLVVVSVVALPQRAGAQSNATFVPSLSLSTVYDDNVFALAKSDAGVMTLLRPGFEGRYESPTVRLSSFFTFDMQHSNFSALSTLDARRHGTFDVSRRMTASTTMALGVRYDRTETPGELNLDTAILGERRTAERLEVIPSFSYRVQPRTTFNASYAAMTESLVDDLRGNLQMARAGVSRQVSTRDDVMVGYLGRRFDDALDMHTSHSVLVGWVRELAPATRLSIQAGPRHSTYQGLTAEVVAGLTRATNRMRIAIDYWHGETVILGIRGPVAVDTTTVKLLFPISQRIELGTHLGVTDSTTLTDQDVRVYRGSIVGSWTPNGGAYTVALSYGGDFQQGIIRRSIFIDDEIFRHTFRVNLTIAPRLSRKFRPAGEPPVRMNE